MRLGLLGGTFDPIHNGHLAAARAAQDALQLDRVRFIPASQPPHRPDSPRASGYHRLEMTRLAIADMPGWEVSDIELARKGPSYTYDTLATIVREGLTPAEMYFITGADAFAEIATWYRYPEVLDLANFVVVARPGTTFGAGSSGAASAATRTYLLAAETPDVSATDIRARASRGESLDNLVPPRVADYIARHSLYRLEHRLHG